MTRRDINTIVDYRGNNKATMAKIHPKKTERTPSTTATKHPLEKTQGGHNNHSGKASANGGAIILSTTKHLPERRPTTSLVLPENPTMAKHPSRKKW